MHSCMCWKLDDVDHWDHGQALAFALGQALAFWTGTRLCSPLALKSEIKH